MKQVEEQEEFVGLCRAIYLVRKDYIALRKNEGPRNVFISANKLASSGTFKFNEIHLLFINTKFLKAWAGHAKATKLLKGSFGVNKVYEDQGNAVAENKGRNLIIDASMP